MNKDELLKIYSAYLPYGLTGQLKYDIKEDFQDDDWTEDLSKFEKGAIWKLAGYADHDLSIPMGEGEFSGWLWRNKNTYAGIDDAIMPILYDLSYLTKEIEHEGKKIIPLEIIKLCTDKEHWNYIERFIYYEDTISLLPWWVIELLLKWHFNIFNLPEDQFINKATLTIK